MTRDEELKELRQIWAEVRKGFARLKRLRREAGSE